MELSNTFTVDQSLEETWVALQDLERMALCMPGATLSEFDGESFAGKVSLKVGPIMMTYTGTGTIVERDDDNHVLGLRLKGKEAKGAGTAAALVQAQLRNNGTNTVVDVSTELALTGKPAQFGRGVLSEVAGTIISKFANNLADQLAPAAVMQGQRSRAEGDQVLSATVPTGAAGPARDEANALDLGSVALSVARAHRTEIIATFSAVTVVALAIRCRSRHK